MRKVPFSFFSCIFLFSLLPFFKVFWPIALSLFLLSRFLASSVSPDQTVERRWGVRLFNCWFYIM